MIKINKDFNVDVKISFSKIVSKVNKRVKQRKLLNITPDEVEFLNTINKKTIRKLVFSKPKRLKNIIIKIYNKHPVVCEYYSPDYFLRHLNLQPLTNLQLPLKTKENKKIVYNELAHAIKIITSFSQTTQSLILEDILNTHFSPQKLSSLRDKILNLISIKNGGPLKENTIKLFPSWVKIISEIFKYSLIDRETAYQLNSFLKTCRYSSLLEQKISEPAVDALKPAGLQGLQDLSKRFSDVFTDERLAQKSVSEIKPKNSFDLSSFRNRMQADGLVFTDEKTDVPEIYKLSETHGMNWYDTYLLAKKTAVNHQIIVKRMQVQLEQAQAQTLGGDSALTETEKKILKAVRSEKPIDYLQSAKGPSGTVTNSEKQILTDLAQRGFMDEVINLMVAYSLGRTRSTNVNREYISKLANDFAFKNIVTAEQGLLALRSGYDKKSQQAKADSKKKTNVPSWSNPDYDNQTSQADQAKLDEIRRRALAKLEKGKE